MVIEDLDDNLVLLDKWLVTFIAKQTTPITEFLSKCWRAAWPLPCMHTRTVSIQQCLEIVRKPRCQNDHRNRGSSQGQRVPGTISNKGVGQTLSTAINNDF